MSWWMYVAIYVLGFIGACAVGYRSQWETISKLKCRRMDPRDGTCRAREWGSGCPMHSRNAMHPNIWDDSGDIFWIPLVWPLAVIAGCLYGAAFGIGWAFRTATRPKQIKYQNLPDLREVNK